jgi:hypothetical protein
LAGAYFGYEPNADAQDDAFIRAATPQDKLAFDPRGRFIPYWFRDKQNPAKLVLAPLIDMETSFYYRGLKNRMTGGMETTGVKLAAEISKHFDPVRMVPTAEKMMITEPYVYEGKMIVEQSARSWSRPVRRHRRRRPCARPNRRVHHQFQAVRHRGLRPDQPPRPDHFREP